MDYEVFLLKTEPRAHLSLRVLQFLLLLLDLHLKDLLHFSLHLLHFHHMLPTLLLHLCQRTPAGHSTGLDVPLSDPILKHAYKAGVVQLGRTL